MVLTKNDYVLGQSLMEQVRTRYQHVKSWDNLPIKQMEAPYTNPQPLLPLLLILYILTIRVIV